MSLNVKLTAPHLSRPGASKPEDSKPDAPKSQDAGSNELWIEIPVAEEDGVKEREAFYLKLLKSSLDDETLSDLRSNIAGHTGSIEINTDELRVQKANTSEIPDAGKISLLKSQVDDTAFKWITGTQAK
ncbi:hypothetical protein NW766_012124 [Fusarium irregulare]|uniref:Uncharacterized protein n=1 Tax=Fusarium irregulare TaxID=2494466 RepID=A0A9W8PFM1_9HYPO|nr:hypothetical protein NW766_012124 [Fusarium irregulare]